jgi:hypothetical protein
MIEDISKRFDNALRDKFKEKPDVLNFLLKHERKHLCIQSLVEQIVRAERYSISIRVETYANIIRDVALMFARAAVEHIEQQHYSAAKVAEIKRKAEHLKDAEEMLKDLEKDSVNDKSLTEIERDEIKAAIKARKANEIQA